MADLNFNSILYQVTENWKQYFWRTERKRKFW